MKKNTVLVFLGLFVFFTHCIIALLDGNLIHRYIGSGLISFIIPFFLLSICYSSRKKTLLIFLVPAIFSLSVAIYSTALGGYVLPLGLIGVISIIFAYYITPVTKKKNKFIVIIYYSLFILITSYIYANWLYGWERETTNNIISNKLILKKNNDDFYLSNKKDKVIVLDVWSTSCGSCIKKFPEFEKQYLSYKNDPYVELYSLYLPVKRDSALDITTYTKNYSFPKLYAQGIDSWNQLSISGLPLIIMLDKKGKIRFRGAMNTNKYLPYNNFNKLIEKLKNE